MLIRKTKLIMFFLLKHTLIIYHTTCLNAILVNKAFKKNSLTTPKAEAARSVPRSWPHQSGSGCLRLFIYGKVRITFKNDNHIVKCV
jgi:hypothetical protein